MLITKTHPRNKEHTIVHTALRDLLRTTTPAHVRFVSTETDFSQFAVSPTTANDDYKICFWVYLRFLMFNALDAVLHNAGVDTGPGTAVAQQALPVQITLRKTDSIIELFIDFAIQIETMCNSNKPAFRQTNAVQCSDASSGPSRPICLRCCSAADRIHSPSHADSCPNRHQL